MKARGSLAQAGRAGTRKEADPGALPLRAGAARDMLPPAMIHGPADRRQHFIQYRVRAGLYLLIVAVLLAVMAIGVAMTGSATGAAVSWAFVVLPGVGVAGLVPAAVRLLRAPFQLAGPKQSVCAGCGALLSLPAQVAAYRTCVGCHRWARTFWGAAEVLFFLYLAGLTVTGFVVCRGFNL